MKVKIHCDSCSRQIAVDEAFVGGVCRCPFCKALVAVDGAVLGGREGSRPESPEPQAQRPSSPASPSARPAAASDLANRAARQMNVPTASPVKVVNIVVIVMALALAAMIVVAVGVGIRSGWFRSTPAPVAPPEAPPENMAPAPRVAPPRPGPTPAQTQPTSEPAPPPEPQPSGPASLAGNIVIEAPVTYCIELGPGRIGQRSGVVALVSESIRTLGPARRFDIAAGTGGEVKWLDGKAFRPGGMAAAGKMEDFFAGLGASGAAPMSEAFAAALKVAPRTVVVLAWSKVEAPEAVARAKKDGVKVVVVCVGPSDAADSLEALARQCGGVFRQMTGEEIETFVQTLEKARAGHEDR